MKINTLILVATIITVSMPCVSREYPLTHISYGGWNIHPLTKVSIEIARKSGIYKIDSESGFFYEYVVEALDVEALKPCKEKVDDWYQIRLVVDLTDADDMHQTFASDGMNLFSEDFKKCRRIDEEFKDKFRIPAFDKPKDSQ